MVAPEGEVTRALSPCLTSRNRTVRPEGVPALSAVDQTSKGNTPTAAATARLGGRHPVRSHAATPTKSAAPVTSTNGPPRVVTYPTGALASAFAMVSR